MSKNKIYGLLTLVLIIISIVIFSVIDTSNNVYVSLAIQVVLILYLVRITYGCILYIKKQYEKQKYSYSITMNLGLVIFLIINIIRQTLLLFTNFGNTSMKDIYNNILDSFHYFAILTVPFITMLSVYGAISNIVFIKKEGFKLTKIVGIVFGMINLMAIFRGQMIFEITNKLPLNEPQICIKRFIDISLSTVIAYWYCLILSTLYCNIMAARHNPSYDKDFVIILGAKIRDDGTLTPLLKARVDRAIAFAKEQREKANKEIIYVPSGGQGEDEVISESEAIKNYLIENGVKPENILIENKSVNTNENMKFSKEKIDSVNKNGKIAFSTTNYHVFRSGVIANKEGIDCEGMGSVTKWYFYSTALVREFIANLFLQRKQHFVLITSINATILMLVLVGFQYHLL